MTCCDSLESYDWTVAQRDLYRVGSAIALIIHSLDLFIRLIPAREFGVTRIFVQPNGCIFVQSRAERRVSHEDNGADSAYTDTDDGSG